ncbi:MAG TPA: hypothetical protein PLG20_08380 [Candidatus Syntrophosphaera sp.]|nr:hypothetical protein [Candidatus Syntrophosphaera sp.]
MSNSSRNTIVLAGLLFLISLFVTFQYFRTHGKTAELRDYNRKAAVTVDSLKSELSVIDSLRQEYQFQQALMGQQSKLILGSDSPSVTYGYLLQLMNWMKANVNYDFAVADTQKTAGASHEYIISGKTAYASLLGLVNQIEKQRPVLTVEDFSISSESAAAADTVAFSMVLHTHFLSGGPDISEIGLKSLPVPYLGNPLFMPRIHEEILPPEVDPSLLNVEEARLVGISRQMAFFRDSRGIIRILSPGSRVAYGYLYKIDEKAGKVVFKLNKYGLEEDFNVLINSNQ